MIQMTKYIAKILKKNYFLLTIFCTTFTFANSINVSESLRVGKEVTHLSAKLGQGTYSLINGSGGDGNSYFTLSTTGMLKLTTPLNYQKSKEFSIRVLRKTRPSIKNFKAGSGQNLIILSDGSLWGYGMNDRFQLGDKTSQSYKRFPFQIERSDVQFALPKYQCTYYLKSDGGLWRMSNISYEPKEKVIETGVASFFEGYYIKHDGSLWSMGYEARQLESSGVSVLATGESSGDGHILYIKSDGSLWGIGENYSGQLGDGTNQSRSNPILIEKSGVKTSIVADDCSFYIKTDGSLWGMGGNRSGQLGDGTSKPRSRPFQIEASGVVSVVSGGDHTLYLKSDGSVWGMGGNGNGELGLPEERKRISDPDLWPYDTYVVIRESPNKPTLLINSGVKKIFTRHNASLFIKNDGSLWKFGAIGQGNAKALQMKNPIVASGVIDASLSYYNTLYLKEDNSLWALGVSGFRMKNYEEIYTYLSKPEQIMKGGLGNKEFTIKIKVLEDKSLPFSLDVGSVYENQSSVTKVGCFISSSSGPVSYSLVSGAGSSGNSNFTLSSAGVLKTAKSLDYERVNKHSIRVLASASGSTPTEKVFTIRVLDVYEPSSIDFVLSSNGVAENQVVGTNVGRFGSSGSGAVSYSLESGAGSSGNPNFTLSSEGILKTAKSFDYEQTQQYSIRVLASASGSTPTKKVFTIRVLDVNETLPFDFVLSSNSVDENSAVGNEVGRFSTDGKDDLLKGLVSWRKFDGDYSDSSGSGLSGTPDGVSFSIDRNGESNRSIYFDGINDTFTFDIGSQHYSNFSVSFWAEPLKATTIVGESTKGGAMATPAHSTLMYYPMGNKGLRQVGFGIVLGSNALNIAHLTGGRAPATLAYPSDMSGWKQYVVCCINNKVRLFVNGNFVKDGLQFDRTNVIGASIILGKNYKNGHYKGSIDNLRIYDRALPLTEVTSLYKKDTDLQEKIEYSLVSGAGSEGNQNFTLSSEGVLKTAKSFDYELKQKHSIRVLAKSSRKTPMEKVFEIEVLDINESNPRLIILSHGKVSENLPIHSKVGEFSIKAGGSAIFELVKGEGDSGNEFFTIASGGILKTSVILNSSQSPTLSIRVQATQLGVRILETFVIEVQKSSLPPPPPPPPPPMNDWKERWEKEKKELVNINNRIEDRNTTLVKLENQIRGVQDQIEGVGKDNVRLDTEISKAETELNQVLARIAELGVKYTDAQKHSEKIILQKSNAEKEVVRLSQEYDLLDEKVKEKREEATTLVAKLKVPFLKGWHYTADKGWLWTDLDYYPIVYSNAEDAWIHYDQGTSKPWHYYNYSTQEWFEWN
jgi:alpha-tubulin suppressor-like RCC1 family protein